MHQEDCRAGSKFKLHQVFPVSTRHSRTRLNHVEVFGVTQTESVRGEMVSLPQPAIAIAVPVIDKQMGATARLTHVLPGRLWMVEPLHRVAGLLDYPGHILGFGDIGTGAVISRRIHRPDHHYRATWLRICRSYRKNEGRQQPPQ